LQNSLLIQCAELRTTEQLQGVPKIVGALLEQAGSPVVR
jgi:hypothetical protein